MVAGFAGVSTQMFVGGWLAFELTDSFAALGAFSLTSGIASLAMSLPGGVLADKVRDAKRFIQLGQAAGAVSAVGMAIAVASGSLRFEHVLVGTALISGAHSLTMPARQALAPAVVGMDRLTNAMALYTSGQNTAFLAAPAVAGGVIGALGSGVGVDGAQYVYILMTAIYVGAALLLVPVRITVRPAGAPRGRSLADLADGFRYAARDPKVRALLAFNAAVALFWGTYISLLPGFAKEVLGVEAGRLGFLFSAAGLGAVAGSLAVASMPSRRRGVIWLLSVVVLGTGQLAFSLSTVYGVSLVIAVLIGLGQAGFLSLGTVLLQTAVEEAYRGRVLSLYLLQFGLMSIGTFGVAVVANIVGAQLAVGAAACAMLGITALLFAKRSTLVSIQ